MDYNLQKALEKKLKDLTLQSVNAEASVQMYTFIIGGIRNVFENVKDIIRGSLGLDGRQQVVCDHGARQASGTLLLILVVWYWLSRQ